MIKIGKEAVDEALKEEIRVTYNETKKDCDLPFHEWLAQDPKMRKKVSIDVAYDMGWNKRSSGRLLSGHAFMIGCRTRKIVGLAMKSKACAFCDAHKDVDVVPDHDCCRNYENSSKAMEADSALDLGTDIFDLYQSSAYVG